MLIVSLSVFIAEVIATKRLITIYTVFVYMLSMRLPCQKPSTELQRYFVVQFPFIGLYID